MAYSKKTLRKMPPVTRKLSKLVSELLRTQRKLNKMIEQVRALERDSLALSKHSCQATRETSHTPIEQSMLAKTGNDLRF
jgi:hypothetical protein